MNCLDLVLGEPCFDTGIFTLRLGRTGSDLLSILLILGHDVLDFLADLEDPSESRGVGRRDSFEVVGVDFADGLDAFGEEHVILCR